MFFVSSAYALEGVRASRAKSILVVDDEKDIRESLQVLLQSEYPHAQVHTADSGPDALAFLEKTPVDLVITDYRMPGMDGLEFLKRVKSRSPKIRRGLITAFDPLSEQHSTLKELDFFLRKPIHIGSFIEATDKSLAPQ